MRRSKSKREGTKLGENRKHTKRSYSSSWVIQTAFPLTKRTKAHARLESGNSFAFSSLKYFQLFPSIWLNDLLKPTQQTCPSVSWTIISLLIDVHDVLRGSLRNNQSSSVKIRFSMGNLVASKTASRERWVCKLLRDCLCPCFSCNVLFKTTKLNNPTVVVKE